MDKTIALYMRLSDEDDNLAAHEESNSISHQRKLMLDHIQKLPELKDCNIMEFSDDGYSGADFSRPNFVKMMDLVKAGKIQVIVTKDYSRLGRDYLEVGNYMECIFPVLQVRYISVNDNYDSANSFGSTGGMSVALKNLVNALYCIATCKHVVLVEIITTFFLFTTQMGEIYSRMSYYIMIPIYILVSYLGRVVLKKIIKKRGFASSKKSLFVIAPEKLLEETLHGLKKNGFGYTQIVAAATDTDLKGKTICEIPIVANHDGIVDYACEEWVDEVLIPPCAESEYPYEMADIFLEMGIAVHRGITKNKAMAGSFNQIEKIGDYTVITASMNYASTTQLFAKRGMDILGGLVGCIITLIVTIFVGPAIYIASPGPIFFAQERIGRNGRKFKMYKFRSMYMDAEERKKELMAQNKVSDGMMFKMDFDPRIIGNKILPDGRKKTGIGQFIRKTSIDELPQFWNILKGDMSLVGTRPPTLDEWEKYEPHHRARMSFRPGLTGLWQVSGRSNITDFEKVVKLDTQYIGEWSVKGDIKIIWQTVVGVLRNDGAM